MRILFILENFYPLIGGSEHLFYALSKYLVVKGWDVSVLTRHRSELARAEIKDGIKITRVKSPNRASFTFYALPKAISMSKKSDLTHTTLYSGAVCAGMAKRVTGKRTLITIHELYKDIWSSLPYISSAHSSAFRKMESKALKMDFDAYVGVSDFTTNQLKQELKENKLIRKIYNGIDYTEFEDYQRRGREKKPFRFVFFGRAGIGKGIDLISGAIRMCLEEDLKDIELNLILAQESSRALQDLKRAANPAVSKGIVKFHRPMERMDLLEFLSACDCALIPSYSEGFCFVAVECAAMGLPVIHSGKGALKETVSGFNIQMSDQTSASLFNAMKDALYNNYDHKPQKRFPVENTIQKYTELYEELIKL